jgi:hypothetical protein
VYERRPSGLTKLWQPKRRVETNAVNRSNNSQEGYGKNKCSGRCAVCLKEAGGEI